jgi:hypothetical protein
MRELIVRWLGAKPPDTLAVVHRLRPVRGARSGVVASRWPASVTGLPLPSRVGPDRLPRQGRRWPLAGRARASGLRCLGLVFRPVIVWGSLAPNSSFKPTLLRNAA